MSFKIVGLLALICCLNLSSVTSRVTRPGVSVRTNSGPVQGLLEFYDFPRSVYTFKGIRYAKAPVGELRFKEAAAPEPWNRTFHAFNYGSQCPQLVESEVVGDEDCLFLNIATPVPLRRRSPVVVYIHGGGLHSGNGEFEGPELINEESVIYVSFNYRLNVLGFFNTGDANSPGNQGLKDMIMVLKWVRDNIASFGGDPDNVTLFGFSGGSVAAHALVVSKAAEGLFNKALSHSGSMFNHWGFNRNPTRAVDYVIETLGLNVISNEDLIQQLRCIPIEELVTVVRSDLFRPNMYFFELMFVPSLDPTDSNETIIFTAPIDELIANGSINRVPYMIGFNSAESLWKVGDARWNPNLFDEFNGNPYLLVPLEWNLLPDSPEAKEVIDEIKRVYFNGTENITLSQIEGFVDYSSDREFIFGVSKLAELHSKIQNVYYFRFSYSGALSFTQRIQDFMDFPGAIHGDDRNYLYHLDTFPLRVSPLDEALLVRLRFVRLWTNFFKYGNPTPSRLDPLLRTNWPLHTKNIDFLNIDSSLTPGVNPFSERLGMWRKFDVRFNR